MSLEKSLIEAIGAGSPETCLGLLHGTSEAVRAAVAVRVFAAFDATHAHVFSRTPKKVPGLVLDPEQPHAQRYASLHAAQAAVLATTSRIEALRKYSWRSIPRHDDAIAVLRDRRPTWILEWAELVCEVSPAHWRLVRALVREGLCPTPATDAYVLGLVHCAKPAWIAHDAVRPPPLLESDPELLETEIWRVFEVEGNRDVSLTGGEGFWQPTLLELEASGRLDRARMLDATLGALARDFAQHKAGFYSRLHDALKPTPTELADRATRYLDLLASRISPTVTLATRALQTIAKAGSLDAEQFVAAAPGARNVRGAAAALAVLDILANIPGEPALRAATAFLEHDAGDVQDAVLSHLEKSVPTELLRGSVRPAVEVLSPSRMLRALTWLGETAPPTAPPAAAVAERPARAPVRPIETHVELFDAVVHVLEEPSDRFAFERMLDGMSRLGAPLDALPADRVKTAKKRAVTLRKRDAGSPAALVAAWLAGEPRLPALPYTAADLARVPLRVFGTLRANAVLARLVRSETRPLLSAPTHEGYFVDARVLVQRAQSMHGAPIDIPDAVLALLRLGREGRDEGLELTPGLVGPLAKPLRHALGGKVDAPDGDQALWCAAARARHPGADDALVATAFPDLGPDGGRAARIAFTWLERKGDAASWGDFEASIEPPLPAVVDPLLVSVVLCTKFHAWGEASVREAASYSPGNRDAFYAWGAVKLRRNLDWQSAEWENWVALEPLLDPDETFGASARVLLAMGLAAKAPRESALSIDVLTRAIDAGRPLGAPLGRTLASLWVLLQEEVTYIQRPSGSRWAKSLGVVARTSPAHAAVVHQALVALLAAAPTSTPPDLHALLELGVELSIELGRGVADADARAFLQGITRSGKTKAARDRLLAVAT